MSGEITTNELRELREILRAIERAKRAQGRVDGPRALQHVESIMLARVVLLISRINYVLGWRAEDAG